MSLLHNRDHRVRPERRSVGVPAEQGATIVDALIGQRTAASRSPGDAALSGRAFDLRGVGNHHVGRVPAGGPPGRRGPGRARRRPRSAGGDPVGQPRGVASGGPRDAPQRERDGAHLPDELTGPGRLHPRPRRGRGVLRGHPRPVGQGSRGSRRAARPQAGGPGGRRPPGRRQLRHRLRGASGRGRRPARPRSRGRGRTVSSGPAR